jgi:UDP-glucose 4-epimerase
MLVISDRVTFRHESILNPDRWAGAMDGCRFVFHLAAMGSVPRSIVEPYRCLDVNVKGTMNVLSAAHQAGVRRVIFSGSSSAYGAAPGMTIKDESMPPLPRSPYAATKLAGEHLMRAWSASYGLDTVVLRYFNIFGPRQNGASAYAAVIAAFAEAMASGRGGTIYGDGSQTRDFTYVANAVYANLLAASHERPLGGDVFNIATGHAPSILELHQTMTGAFGLQGALAAPAFKPERRGDVSWSRADISLAREGLGYRPLVSFEQGLAATVRWYQDRLRVTARAAA